MEKTTLAETVDDLVLRVASAKRPSYDRHAQRALLAATEDLTLAIVAACNRLREQGTTFEQLFGELVESRILLAEVRGRNEIMAERLAAMEPRQRPHYSPRGRFRILEHMRMFLLTVAETARHFLLTPQTIYN